MTQTAPTNRHEFYRRKALTAEERPEDWREVTDAEKQALEAADAQWRRPEQSLIDRWNLLCMMDRDMKTPVGKYNEETGFFEGNGIKNITTSQAEATVATYQPTLLPKPMFCRYSAAPKDKAIRTNLPFQNFESFIDISNAFKCARDMEVIALPNYYGDARLAGITEAFAYCTKLRKIMPQLGFDNIGTVNSTTFRECYALEEMEILKLHANLNVQYSPLLNLNSFKVMVTNASNTSPITITVHPDVYAKLTDEGNEEWSALNRMALERQITFATP